MKADPMRIENHPILTFPERKRVPFSFDGREIEGREGEPIAAALLAAGVRGFSYSPKYHRPRGFFCAVGRCASCLMEVNGVANVRICVTPLEKGMKVRSQRRAEKLK